MNRFNILLKAFSISIFALIASACRDEEEIAARLAKREAAFEKCMALASKTQSTTGNIVEQCSDHARRSRFYQ